MPRKKRQLLDNTHIMFLGIIVGLLILLIVTMVQQSAQDNKAADTVPSESRVSLGAMQYDFSSGKAVKRDDETVKSLRSFLITLAEQDEQQDCESYYNVVMASSDEQQVLLHYGCPYPAAGMFAVNEGGAWRTLSPTNKFDMFGIPACEHVNENGIDKSIAPVCVNGLVDAAGSRVLTYTVR